MKCSERKLCDNDDCKVCFDKSAASLSNDKLERWSNKNTLTPRQVFKTSGKKIIFDCCTVCFHEYITTVKSGCIYCANQRLCDSNGCKTCFIKSFALSKRATYRSSKNGDITPRQVFRSAKNKYLFDCDDCGHTFYISLNSIASHDCWCKFCANQSLCDDEKCEICFGKSFAPSKRSIYNRTQTRFTNLLPIGAKISDIYLLISLYSNIKL